MILLLHSSSTHERKLMEKDNDTQYEAPRIEDHGDLADLTAGLHEGELTDAAFPINTPKKNLTFSTP
jgi:hypothetical protein